MPPAASSAWVRAGVMMGVEPLAAELGGDAVALGAACGIDPAAFADPDFPIPVRGFAQLLERAAAELACPNLGLRLSQRQEMSLFGPLWPFLANSATVGELVREVAHVFPLHTPAASPQVEPTEGGLIFVYDAAGEVGAPRRQLIELGIGVLVGEIRRLCPDWRPEAVQFRHAAPADLELHHRLLGPNLLFEADRNTVFLDAAALATPYGAGDASLAGAWQETLASRLAALDGLIQTRTEAVVRNLLPFGRCDLAAVAAFLRLTPRTLQRRLAADGTSFEQILDGVRADLALYYLRESRLSVAAVAEILQFSETSALTRACRRWHGASPRAVRATT
jgi:AraC-like DNA-binding protein